MKTKAPKGMLERIVIYCTLGSLCLIVGPMSGPGWIFPTTRDEQLNNPLRVVGWTEKGLQLSNGKIVMPLGMTKLPNDSKALEEVTRRGVEVLHNGKTTGLIKVWHWCGNDSMRHDVQRVDVAKFLAYLGEGSSVYRFERPAESFSYRPGSGWNISHWASMNRQERSLKAAGKSLQLVR